MIFIGIAILIILFISTNRIEKSLLSIEDQNNEVIELLKEIKEKP